MAVKISESEWSKFTEKVIKDGKLDPKLKLDDAALVKALGAYDKTDASKPEPHLKALDELIKQIPEQVKALVKRKKELGDKPFGQLKDRLYELLEAAEDQRKAAMDKAAEAKAAESKGKGKADEDDETDTPALLNTKMIPLLRELRKGETQMHAVICTAGKNTAVLIMRRPISKSRYPLLAEAVDAKGGMKYIVADCLFELQSKLLTFVVKSPGAQLAKRVRQALLDQTQLRFRVKVRGEDGVEEHDGEDEGDDQAGVKAQAQKAPPGGPASAEQLAYTQRLLKVRERYEQALKQQHPEATKLRALMGLASEKADAQKNFAPAIQALQAMEKVLDADASAPTGGVDPAAAFKARLTALIPKIKDAQSKSQPGAPDAKLKASEAGVWAGKRDFERAGALLDEAENLLKGQAATGVGGLPDQQGLLGRMEALSPRVKQAVADNVPFKDVILRTAATFQEHLKTGQLAIAAQTLADLEGLLQAAASTKPGFVDYAKARLVWVAARNNAGSELKKLEREIIDEYKDEPAMLSSVTKGVRRLDRILAALDESLADRLDEGINATEPTKRARLNQQVLEIIDRYLDFLESDPLVAAVEDNPFTSVGLGGPLSATLKALASQLA